jgi:hypothetical protein
MEFLPLEPDVCQARLLTFGYDANIIRAGSASISILDFAKDLLFDLKYATNEETEHLDIGKVGARQRKASKNDVNWKRCRFSSWFTAWEGSLLKR